jgi:hypothetical protein
MKSDFKNLQKTQHSFVQWAKLLSSAKINETRTPNPEILAMPTTRSKKGNNPKTTAPVCFF